MSPNEVQAVRRELNDYPDFRVEVERDDVLDTLVVKVYDTNRQKFYSFWSWTYFQAWLWEVRHWRYATPLRSAAQPMQYDPAEYDYGTPDGTE